MTMPADLTATEQFLTDRNEVEERLHRIASLQESDLRGHSVALTYHQFAQCLDEYVWGPRWSVRARLRNRQRADYANANWFNFALWATVTINRDIRHKSPPLRMQRVLPFSLRPRLAPALMGMTAADGQRISRALSWGQRLVFLSTTYAFLDLTDKRTDIHETFALPAEDEDSWVSTVLEQSEWGGYQSLSRERHLAVVARAFDCYRKAKLLAETTIAGSRRARRADGSVPEPAQPRSKAIAREILMGNLLLTAVEQDVVDLAVKQVIDHLPRLTAAAATGTIARWAEGVLGVPRQLAAFQLPYWLAPASSSGAELWARFVTDQILIMNLPSETLRMGRDIPPRNPTSSYFPAELAHLDDVEDLGPLGELKEEVTQDCEELARLVGAFDRSRAAGRGSGAWDWRRYDDRMNWAVTLVRSRQQDPSLFWAPYDEEDAARILAGRRPQSNGDPANFEVLAPVDGSVVWPDQSSLPQGG